MRVPFLRSSPAVRSTSNTSKRRVFLAGLLGGVDTAAGSLAFANFLSPRTQWGRSSTVSEPSKARQCFFHYFVLKLRHPPRRCHVAAGGPARVGRSPLHQPGAALQYSGVSRQPAAGSAAVA